MDVALKAHQSWRKHFTEALAGESSGPSQPLLSAPPEVPPREASVLCWPGPPLATTPWEGHPESCRSAVRQR